MPITTTALPSSWYVDADHFDAERRSVLWRSWQYAADTGALAAEGDRVTNAIAGHTIDVVRTDGALVATSEHGPAAVETWGPMVWVNVDPAAAPLRATIPGLPELIASHGIDVDAYRLGFERSWAVAANWKVMLDNAIECYHCPVAHPELSRVIETDPARQELIVGGRWWTSSRIPFRREPTIYWFHWVLPTTYLQYAGSRLFDIGSIEVLDVDHILFRSCTYVPLGEAPEVTERLAARYDDNPTVEQDVGICERVQVAHASGVAPPGHLLPRSESLLVHFQRVLAEEVSAGGSAAAGR